MPKVEIDFTVRPNDPDFDQELLARIVAPYARKSDSVSTQFALRCTPVFHFDGTLQYANWDVNLELTWNDADELCRKLAVMFPRTRPTVSENRPDDADWYGMFTSRGAEEVAKLINATTDRIAYADDDSLRVAFEYCREAIDELGRDPRFAEVNDTAVREVVWNRVEAYAKNFGHTDFAVQDAYDAVGC